MAKEREVGSVGEAAGVSSRAPHELKAPKTKVTTDNKQTIFKTLDFISTPFEICVLLD